MTLLRFPGSEIGLDGNKEVIIEYHPIEEGIVIAGDLSKSLTPVMMEIYVASESEGLNKKEAVTLAVQGLYRCMDGAELLQLAKKLLRYTRVSIDGTQILALGQSSDFNKFLEDRQYGVLVPLMARVIDHNNFLDLDIGRLAMGRTAEA